MLDDIYLDNELKCILFLTAIKTYGNGSYESYFYTFRYQHIFYQSSRSNVVVVNTLMSYNYTLIRFNYYCLVVVTNDRKYDNLTFQSVKSYFQYVCIFVYRNQAHPFLIIQVIGPWCQFYLTFQYYVCTFVQNLDSRQYQTHPFFNHPGQAFGVNPIAVSIDLDNVTNCLLFSTSEPSP